VTERDDLDGCDIVGPESRADPLDDRDVPWLVLFAARLRRGDARRIREFREAFG
jgi:hypothetical protein